MIKSQWIRHRGSERARHLHEYSPSMHVVSINVGKAKQVTYRTSSVPLTASEKRPVEGAAWIGADGVEGDDSGDRRVHHDDWMKVYAYSLEDYSYWSSELGAPVGPGQFSENLTTSGVDLNAALVGEVWRVGGALLQISHVRIPCQTFKGWMGASGYDETAWVKRFTAAGRPGPYFRVMEEGEVRAGDAITVEARPSHDVTVAELFRALTTERSLLPRLAQVDGLKPWIYDEVREAL